VIQILTSLATHSVALVVYPGLVAVVIFGGLVELVWVRLTEGAWPEPPRRRPTPVIATVVLCSVLAASQLAAPLSPMPPEERSAVIAAVALAFTVWAELALTQEFVAEPGVILVVQICWLLAVLGPAVQPESLRPQALGNVLVPALLPLKVACGFLYLLCLPVLLRLLRPPAADRERRKSRRFDVERGLSWFPYCGLFTSLFFPPAGDDVVGLLRFFGITAAVAGLVIVAGAMLRRWGVTPAWRLYGRAVPSYAALVLVVLVGTSFLQR
jgi:hypothetical protein